MSSFTLGLGRSKPDTSVLTVGSAIASSASAFKPALVEAPPILPETSVPASVPAADALSPSGGFKPAFVVFVDKLAVVPVEVKSAPTFVPASLPATAPCPCGVRKAALVFVVRRVAVVAGSGSKADALLSAARRLPYADTIVLHAPAPDALPAAHPARDKIAVAGDGAAFVCRGERCSLPITAAAQLPEAVNAMRG